MDPKAIVFDLDGTLCEYGLDAYEAIGRAFVAAGQAALWQSRVRAQIFTRRRYLEHLAEAERLSLKRRREDGTSPFPYGVRVEAMRRLLQETGIRDRDRDQDQDQDESLSARLHKAYLEVLLESLSLRPGAAEVVGALRPRYRLGLLTNGPSSLQWAKIRRLGIEPWFDAVVVSEDVGVWKPEPAIFRALLQKLKLEPEQAVYVGDDPYYDVLGARKAGWKAVWLNPASSTPPKAGQPSPAPDREIRDLRELLPWLLPDREGTPI